MTDPPDSAVIDRPLDHSGLAARRVVVAAPSPAIVVALCACAVATGVLAPGGVTGGRLVLQVRRRRLAPIRPSARRALAEFRRELDALPETTHPIGR